MGDLDSFVEILNYILSNKAKRHIVGGILLSVSVMFGGLAITAMTLKGESDE